MLQQAKGAIALLGGALLAGSFVLQTAGGFQQEPSSVSAPALAPLTPAGGSQGGATITRAQEKQPGKRAIPANSYVRGASEPAQVAAPLPKDQHEARILGILDELDHHRQGTMNVPREDGRMLRLLAESVGARNVVELGTSNGFSGLWFCLALEKTHGHLTTFDIDQGRFELAKANFKRAGVEPLVTQVLGDAHEEVARIKEPIDVLFIDADKEGYLDYLTKLLPLLRPGGLILSHNMASPYPDPRFVKAITTNPELETLFINMHDQGLGISLKKR
jgi:predicted O-methyltransferase YrrM